nr:efflux RND transporter permease subunit [Spelaeicoccus albus]
MTRLSLANRAIVGLLALIIIGFGVYSTASLKRELIPSLQLPVAAVVTPYQGASPSTVEKQVTAPIEDAVKTVNGVKKVTSTSSTGNSTVTVELEYGESSDDIRTNIQRAVDGVGSQLPDDVSPTVIAGSLDEIPVVQLSASSDAGRQQFAADVKQDVLPKLRSLDGVRDATLSGEDERQVTVTLRSDDVAAAGIDPANIGKLLEAAGAVVPAGELTNDGKTLSVQVGSAVSSVKDLRDLPLPTKTGPVLLGSIADVKNEPSPKTSISRTDGKPSLGISITKAQDGNTVDVSHEVADALPGLTKDLGHHARFTTVFDQAPFIEQSIHDLTVEGGLGLLFAVIVILLFLVSLRSTIITAISIPMSLLIALIGLKIGGYSLNIITLGALTVAVGRVVDDSIVVVENVKRHLNSRASAAPLTARERMDTVLLSVREVAGAITASTLTTVAVFLPIAFVGGQTGELFRPFAVSVTVALAASLLVSLTVVPTLASWFMSGKRPKKSGTEPVDAGRAAPSNRIQRGYAPILRGVISHPVWTLILAVLIFAGTIAATPLMKTNFLGDSGQDTLSITQDMPIGTSLGATDNAAHKVEHVLADTSGIKSFQTTVGSGGNAAEAAFAGGSGGSNTASFSITLKSDADPDSVSKHLRSELGGLSGAGEVTVQGSQASFGGGTLDVVVHGGDTARLRRGADKVTRLMSGISGLSEVSSNLSNAQPVVTVHVDRDAAAQVGLTQAQIGQSVATAMRGQKLGAVTIDGTSEDIVLKSGDAPATADDLKTLPIRTAAGPSVPLERVADVKTEKAPASITRIDSERSATVSGTVDSDDLGSVTSSVTSRLDSVDLPHGVSASIGGVSQDQSDAFAQLGLAMLVAIAMVYLVMVATFRSLMQPFILLVSIPFAATGALVLLLATDTALGVPALIGLLMLIGIVVTNAIVLIDLVNQFRRSGATIDEAVASGAGLRVRPIVMTALATIFALLPMSLGLTGGGVFISKPLAIVVIGGLVSSTVLTLLLVPVLYTLLERRRERRSNRRSARRGEPSGGRPEPPRGRHAALEAE